MSQAKTSLFVSVLLAILMITGTPSARAAKVERSRGPFGGPTRVAALGDRLVRFTPDGILVVDPSPGAGRRSAAIPGHPSASLDEAEEWGDVLAVAETETDYIFGGRFETADGSRWGILCVDKLTGALHFDAPYDEIVDLAVQPIPGGEAVIALTDDGALLIGVCGDFERSTPLPTSSSRNAYALDLWDLPGQRANASSLILLGVTDGAFVSTDGGQSFTKGTGLSDFSSPKAFASFGSALYAGTSNGVFRSTDSGASWTAANTGLPSSPTVAGLAAGTSALLAAVGGGIYRSTDGASWSAASSGIHATSTREIATNGGWALVNTNSGVFRSTDDGVSWSEDFGGVAATSIKCLLSIDGQTILAGSDSNASAIYRSNDAGVTYSAVGAGLENKLSQSIVLVSPGTLLATVGGRVEKSTDSGATWAESSGGLPSGAAKSLAVSGANGWVTVASGGVSKTTNSGSSWSGSSSGLPNNSSFNSIGVLGSVLVVGRGSYPGPAMFRSGNKGSAWSEVPPLPGTDPTKQSYSLDVLVTSSSAFYVAGYGVPGIYTSTDGSTWTAIGSGIPTTESIYALEVSGEPVLYAGSGTGVVYRSTDGGGSWSVFASGIAGSTRIQSLAKTQTELLVGTSGNGVVPIRLADRTSRLVPIVADLDNGAVRYATELTLTNRGTAEAALTLTYTASLGQKAGSGTVADSLPAGTQRVITDTMAYLRGKGLPIPPGTKADQQAGTLLVTFDGVPEDPLASVLARTTAATVSPQPIGSAGLAYGGLDPSEGITGSLALFGLRASSKERSNVAVFNPGTEPVTVRVMLHSGSGDGKSAVVREAETLPAYGWVQYNSGTYLDANGITNGYVVVERTSSSGSFSAYGTVNDNATQDGSWVLPVATDTLLQYLNVPVLVETSAYVSELVLTNRGATSATFTLTYAETLSPSAGAGGSATLTLAAGEQKILSSGIDFLRQNGAAIGPKGGNFAGALHIALSGVDASEAYAGARIASQSPASTGGQFGLFLSASYPGEEADDSAFVYALRSDADNRTNVGMVNVAGSSPITLSLQAYDAAGGAATGDPTSVTIDPGHWLQSLNFLQTKGLSSGWVKITRTDGDSRWIAYGVINDGGKPGERTGDPAYIPMVK